MAYNTNLNHIIFNDSNSSIHIYEIIYDQETDQDNVIIPHIVHQQSIKLQLKTTSISLNNHYLLVHTIENNILVYDSDLNYSPIIIKKSMTQHIQNRYISPPVINDANNMIIVGSEDCKIYLYLDPIDEYSRLICCDGHTSMINQALFMNNFEKQKIYFLFQYLMIILLKYGGINK